MPAVKLAVTSDLHAPTATAEALARLVGEVAAFAPDVFVVAGDVAETVPDFERCLDLFRQALPCPILVLAGNHDVWVRREADSQRLWQEVLPRLTAQAGCTWLEGQAFVLRGVAVAGTIAWYDYSAADPHLGNMAETYARQKVYHNADALLIDWPWSDQEFAALVGQAFLDTLDRLEAAPAVRQTVVVTHVPLLECQMYRKPDDHAWAFSNAYFGNLTLGRHVLARKKVRHVISGHTHVGREAVVRTEDGRGIAARVLASDYRRPVWVGLTVEADGP